MKAIIKQIYKKIKSYETIVIARHVGPDPDAVASQIALRDSIKATFPKKKVFAVGKNVSRFKYYGTLDKISIDVNDALLIVLDVPNLSRIDAQNVDNFKEILKIDHHPYEDYMGKVEWVDTSCSSTSQMIIELILNTKLKFNPSIAQNLFLGVVSDSDRFLVSSTSLNTFKLVAELIKKTHIDFVSLYAKLYERPINEIKFHGYIAQNLQVSANGLAHIIITPEILEEYKVDSATPSNMINDFNFIKDIYVWIFVTYDDKNKIYKVNIRSRGPIINDIASHYNGGGHKYASGLRTTNFEDINLLIKELDEACAAYKE